MMRIGLSKAVLKYDDCLLDAIDQRWYEVLRGHSLFFVPNTLNQDFNLMANDLDSFILSGGEYTETRRLVELELANKMIERNKPVVAISNSAYLVVEMLGGTLETSINRTITSHPIFYHREVLEVNSHHDSLIKKLPDSANVLCMDYLGNIESFINDNLAGVLWNPERMKEPWIPPEIAYMLKI